MERVLQIQHLMKVWSKVATTMLNPSFKFSGGGATLRVLTKFLDNMEGEFGAVTPERLVDFCICAAYTYRNRPYTKINNIFGPSMIQRIRGRKGGVLWHEDEWIQSKGLTRAGLLELIQDRTVHPLAKFIYVPSEESTKMRMLNREVGYIICQASTLGWSHKSAACNLCDYTEKCKKETEIKYPELYRIRIEDGNKE